MSENISSQQGVGADMPVASTAVVSVERAARYAKQLVSHMGRKFGGEWDKDRNVGHIVLFESRVDVAADDKTVTFEMRQAPGNDLSQLEDAIGRHLVRFAKDQHVVVAWTRTDGSEGTVQETNADGEAGE